MGVAEALSKLFRYELTDSRPVGRGGCGQVWRAIDTLLDRPVAIKTISEALFLGDPKVAERTFIKEAVAGARLAERSRHIVKVFDVGIMDGVPFFAMEWIEPESPGASVDISNIVGACALGRAKQILFEVCDAVAVAHKAGIVHSDIAPWNIVFVPNEGIYKLSDFGLLKIVEENLLTKGSGSLLKGGRADFLPPEAALDIRSIVYACDVHALALTFRILLAGDGCLRFRGGRVRPTPQVIRVIKEQRDAPDQVRQLLVRFIDNHTPKDTVEEFVSMLQRIPN